MSAWLILSFISGCLPAKYAEVDQPLSAADTGAEEPAPESADIVLSVAWDGASSLVAEWTSPPELSSDARLMTADGELLAEERGAVSGITFEGLDDGEYVVEVDGRTADGGLAAQVQVKQYVGSNRLLYRSEISLPGAMDVWGQDDIAVIAGGLNRDTGALIVDVSDPLDPQVIHTMTDIGYVRDIKVWDGLLFTAVDPDADGCVLCDDVGVRIYDFSDPANPALLSTIEGAAYAIHNMSYSNGFLYVCSMIEQMVAVYDVREPDDPVRVSTWYSTGDGAPPGVLHGMVGGPHDLTAIGDRLYVAHLFGFSVLDISDPSSLEELVYQRVDMGMHNVWPNGDGSRLVGTQEIMDGPMTLWDISDLDDVHMLDSRSTGEDRSVHNAYYEGDTVFVAWYIDGVMVFETESDGSLIETGHDDTFDGALPDDLPPGGEPVPPIVGAWGVWPFGDHVVVGDTVRGLIIYDYYARTIESE